MNGRAIVLSAVLVAAGFLSGVILNAVNHRQQLDYVPWSDPIVWRLGGMMAWLVVAAVFSRFYRPANQGRKVAYLTVASFVFLAVTLPLRLFVETEHGPRGEKYEVRRQGEVVRSPALLVSQSSCLFVSLNLLGATSTHEVAR